MVHISEITHAYVNDIHDHLQEGQDVKVMVIGLENGKVNLSIKRLQPKPQRENAPFREHRENREPRENRESRPAPRAAAPVAPPAPKTADQLFEEKLKAFMQESDAKIASSKQYADRSRGRRRG